MFDMGMWEILLIGVILLIVVGPERLPKLARTAGLWINKARSMVASVRSEVERELRVEELRRSISEQTKTEEFRKLTDEVKAIGSDLGSSIDKSTSRVGDTLRSVGGSKTDASPVATPDNDPQDPGPPDSRPASPATARPDSTVPAAGNAASIAEGSSTANTAERGSANRGQE